jgi:hypothetical protein
MKLEHYHAVVADWLLTLVPSLCSPPCSLYKDREIVTFTGVSLLCVRDVSLPPSTTHLFLWPERGFSVVSFLICPEDFSITFKHL